MFKKLDLKRCAALSLAVTCTVLGITFMAVSDDIKSEQALKQEEAAAYSVPDAGLSTQILLSSISQDTISAEFVYATAVAQQNVQETDSIIAAIDDAISEIEIYVSAAKEDAAAYDEAQESYKKALAALNKAKEYREAANEAVSYVFAAMYVQDTVDLIDTAKAAAENAAAEAAAAAEAEAAAEAAAAAAAYAAEIAALRQEIADYACSFVGKLPYVKGGTSLTSGVDCSGFTSAVYAHFGYTLSHSSSAQSKQGRSVSLSEIKVGDIVVYSGHVAIYIGSGRIVHAPREGRYIETASIYIMKILDIRRIIE